MKQTIEVKNQRYRLGYHITAPAGWINDPNGFCYFKGYYHIFYQHHPYSADWGPMHWGHARSRDLVHWETLPIALAPDSSADEDGCFSGSAIVKDDVLYLVYTGHHYYGDNDPDHFWQNQNLAYSTDGIHFTKYENNPIISHAPSDNTHHFRDPKVWQKDGTYYMVLGSQNKEGLGRVITYSSQDLKTWDYLGEMTKAKSATTEGFMWECPDFFSLRDGEEEKDVLLFSPQGITPVGHQYLNLFQTGYFVGEYHYETNTFEHGSFHELDFGHDFYATQTTLAPDGRRLVFGWMDMWESEFPEKEDGWAGALTLPRELILSNDRLLMKPAKELEKLRVKQLASWSSEVQETAILCENERQAEILVTLGQAADCQLTFKDSKNATLVELRYQKEGNQLVLTRENEDPRYAQLTGGLKEMQIFIDTSSVEIFLNQGMVVFTERFYSEDAPKVSLVLENAVALQNETYRLKA